MQGARASMLFILTTTLFDSMSLGLANPVLPQLLQTLTGASPSETGHLFGLLLAANSTMLFLAAPVIGRISDRVGRRPVIIIALFGVLVNSLVAATVNSLPLLFLSQMIAGICGASMTAAAAYVADVTPREKRAQNFGLLSAMFGAGFVIGPSVGGLLAEFSPRLPFLAAAALAAINIVYGLLVLPESLPPERRRPLSLKGMLPFSALMRLPVGSTILALAGMPAGAAIAPRRRTPRCAGWTPGRDDGLHPLRFGNPRLDDLSGHRLRLGRTDRAACTAGNDLPASRCRQARRDARRHHQPERTWSDHRSDSGKLLVQSFHRTRRAIQIPGAAFYLATAAIGLAAMLAAITFHKTKSETAATPG